MLNIKTLYKLKFTLQCSFQNKTIVIPGNYRSKFVQQQLETIHSKTTKSKLNRKKNLKKHYFYKKLRWFIIKLEHKTRKNK